MILVLDGLKEYLEMTFDGYKVKPDCPPDKLTELKQLNDEYMRTMGEPLFIFNDN